MRRSGQVAESPSAILSGARGAAGTLVIAFLPVLLAAMAALAGLGHANFWRQRAHQAADLGALAGVQSLDFDQLAQGVVYLLVEQAMSVAEETARANLTGGSPDAVTVNVTVLNTADGPATDPVTGRIHEHPTVCVQLTVTVQFRLGPVVWTQAMTAHADAAVVPR